MSPRSKMMRKVLNPPTIKGFKPYGPDVVELNTLPVILLFEEYEALRLSDYDHLNHHQASVAMCISRPTFTRVYASALRKIAQAFVEARPISIEGGKVYYDSEWFECANCHSYFNHPDKSIDISTCPLCGKLTILNIGNENPSNRHKGRGRKML